MAIYNEDIVNIDLTSGTIFRSFINRSIGKGDIKANRFGVRVFRDGSPVNVGALSCQGYFSAPNGANISITGSDYTGTDGNKAWVQLPQACYNYDGQFSLSIKIIDISGGITGTVRIVDGTVDNTGTDNAIVPPPDAPTWEEIIAAYDEMLEAKAGSVRYDIEQELTTEERTQARDNIGMVSIEFSQIEGNEYIMTVSTTCEFTNIQDNEYMLVMHAD